MRSFAGIPLAAPAAGAQLRGASLDLLYAGVDDVQLPGDHRAWPGGVVMLEGEADQAPLARMREALELARAHARRAARLQAQLVDKVGKRKQSVAAAGAYRAATPMGPKRMSENVRRPVGRRARCVSPAVSAS